MVESNPGASSAGLVGEYDARPGGDA